MKLGHNIKVEEEEDVDSDTSGQRGDNLPQYEYEEVYQNVDAFSEKYPDALRTISEVSAELNLPPHVLRFWESKFRQIKPVKRAGGRRYYRNQDIAIIGRIRDLLYSQGFTIRGVQKILQEEKTQRAVSESSVTNNPGSGEARSNTKAEINNKDRNESNKNYIVQNNNDHSQRYTKNDGQQYYKSSSHANVKTPAQSTEPGAGNAVKSSLATGSPHPASAGYPSSSAATAQSNKGAEILQAEASPADIGAKSSPDNKSGELLLDVIENLKRIRDDIRKLQQY